MAITTIPNQPVNLSYVDRDSCLPTDNQKYCASYKYGDTIYCQVLNIAAGSSNGNPSFDLSGDELVTNGTFVTDLSGWTISGGTTWNSSGGADISSAIDVTFAQSGINIPFGGWKQIAKFVFSNFVAGDDFTLTVDMDGALSSTYDITANGIYYIPLPINASPTSMTVFLSPSTGGGIHVTLNEVSILTYAVSYVIESFGDPFAWSYQDGGIKHNTGNTDYFSLTPTCASGAFAFYNIPVNVDGITAGSLEVKQGATVLGTITANGQNNFYAILAGCGANIDLIPSSDFDGRVTYFDVVEYAGVTSASITDMDGTPYLDLIANSKVSYVEDRVIIAVNAGDAADEIGQGCYKLHIETTYPTTQTYDSNCISVQETMDCGKLIQGYGDSTTRSYGFLWTNFRLSHRIEFLKFNPEYPTDSDDYEFSDGSRNYTYAKREKYYTGKVNYVDETAHDTISTQVLCKYFYVDGVRYFVKPNNYKPVWDKEGAYELAQANIELRKFSSTIYSNNA